MARPVAVTKASDSLAADPHVSEGRAGQTGSWRFRVFVPCFVFAGRGASRWSRILHLRALIFPSRGRRDEK